MTELALVALVAAVLAFHGWTERRHAADRNRLLDAVMARNAGEFAGLRSVDEPRKPRRKSADADYQLGS